MAEHMGGRQPPALKYLSVCSGIEAATVASEPLGFRQSLKSFQSGIINGTVYLRLHHPSLAVPFGDGNYARPTPANGGTIEPATVGPQYL